MEVDLNDKLYDWAVKAVIITKYPELYSYILSEQVSEEYITSILKERKKAGYQIEQAPTRMFDHRGNLIVDVRESLLTKIKAEAKVF